MSSIQRIRKPINLESTVNAVTSNTDKNHVDNLLKKFVKNNLAASSESTFLRLPRPKFIGDYLKISVANTGNPPSLVCELDASTAVDLTINGGAVQSGGGATHTTAKLTLVDDTDYIAYATSLINWNVYKRDIPAAAP